MSLHLILSDDYAQSRLKDGIVKTIGMILIDAPFEVEAMGYMFWPSYVLFSPDLYYNSRGCNLSTICYPSILNRIISVGAMHHRTQFTNIWGDSASSLPLASEEGQLGSFSSCGPTLDGRIKPDVVAPGHNIISALNSFYYKFDGNEERKDAVEPMTAYTTEAYGRTYGMWAQSGTSMATEGSEAVGTALVKLRSNGKLYSGNGISTDIIGASIRAYLNAINKIVYEEKQERKPD